MKRLIAATAAALTIGTVGVMAASHFTDVPADHQHAATLKP